MQWMQDPMMQMVLEALVVAVIGIIGALAAVAIAAVNRWRESIQEERARQIAMDAVSAVEQTGNGMSSTEKLARALEIAKSLGVELLPEQVEAALKQAKGWYEVLPMVGAAGLRLEGTD